MDNIEVSREETSPIGGFSACPGTPRGGDDAPSTVTSPAVSPAFIVKPSTENRSPSARSAASGGSASAEGYRDGVRRDTLSHPGFQAKMIMEECYALRGRVRTLNSRVKGPVSAETDRNTALPMVFLLGNHSSGKSSFINYVLQSRVQECGVAPTDDKFTVIAGGDEDSDKDGYSLIGDPHLGFAGLRSFGPSLVHHTQFKLRKDLAVSDIMFVDSPGMIDSPEPSGHRGSSGSAETYDRGYDFARVVQWFAKRADVILLFFDNEKPGTTGETMSILTNSLVGMDNKLLIILNKVDQFDKIHDFARVYGSLCWNLSKVIHRKDLPPIYPTCLPNKNTHRHREGAHNHGGGNDGRNIFADDLASTKDVIIKEILSAPYKRVDNEIQRLHESMFSLQMHCKIVNEMLTRYTSSLWRFRGRMLAGVAAFCGVSYFSATNWKSIPEISGGALLSSALALFGLHWWQAATLKHDTASLLQDPNVLHNIYESVYDESIAVRDESVAAMWASVLQHIQIKISPDDLETMNKVDFNDLDLIDKILNTNIYRLRQQISPNLQITN